MATGANPTIHVGGNTTPSGGGATIQPNINPTINITPDVDPDVPGGGSGDGGGGGFTPEPEPVEVKTSSPVAETGYDNKGRQPFRAASPTSTQASTPTAMDAATRADILGASYAEKPTEEVQTDGYMDDGKKKKRQEQPANDLEWDGTNWWRYTDQDGNRVHATKAWGPWEYYTERNGTVDLNSPYTGPDRRQPTEADLPTKQETKPLTEEEQRISDDYFSLATDDALSNNQAEAATDQFAITDEERSRVFNQDANEPAPEPEAAPITQEMLDNPRFVPAVVGKEMFDNPERANDIMSKYRKDRSNTSSFLSQIGLTSSLVDTITSDMSMPAKERAKEAEARLSKTESRRRANERRFAAQYQSGDFNIEGQYLTQGKDGHYYSMYPPAVEDCIKTVSSVFGWDPAISTTDVFKVLRLALGYSSDRDAKIWDSDGKGGKKFNEKAFESFVIHGTRLITASITECGDPFKFTRANIDLMGEAGGLRFPVGVVPAELAAKMAENENSIYHGMSVQEIQNRNKQHWLDTKANLTSYAVANRREDMLETIEDMARALCRMDPDLNPRDYNIDDVGTSFSDAYKYNVYFRDGLNRVDPERANDVADAELRRYNKAAERRSKIFDAKADPVEKKRIIKDKDGNFVREEKYYTGRPTDEAISFGLNVWRMFHTFGSIPLMLSAPIEQAKGLFESNMMSRWELHGKDKSKYQLPHDWFKDMGSEKEFLDAFNAAQLLIQVDDNKRDLLLLFAREGKPLTTANAQAFIQTQIPEASMPRIRKLSQKAQKVSDAIMVGDMATQKIQARQLMQNFMVEQSKIDGISGATLAEALDQNPIEVFTEITKSEAFWSAYHRTVNGTYKRISPATTLAKSVLGKHGRNDLLSTFIFNAPFFTYGIQVLEAWVPFSNTMEYMATYGLVKSGKVDQIAMEQSIGGMGKNFGEGLKLCLRYDLLRFGGTAAQALAHIALMSIFGGIEPPDDDDDDDENLARRSDYRYWKLPNPITGEKEPVMVSWWLDDLTQWSIPLAVGISAFNTTGDIKLAFDIAFNGGLDMLAGNRCLQGLEAIASIPETLKKLAMGEGDEIAIPDMEKELENRLLRMFSDPMILSQFHDMLHEGEYEKDVYKKLDGTSRTDSEARINAFALNNDLFGGILGLFTDYGWAHSADRTEYDKDEEQMAKEKGFATWCENTHMSMDDAEAQDLYAQHVLDALSNYDTIADAAAAGWRLSKQDANYVSFYINDLVSEKIKDLNYNAVNNPSAYYASKDAVWAEINMLQDIKDDLFYEKLIFNKDEYKVVYNTQVNPGRAVDENGKRIYLDYGNKPAGPLSLWSTPDTGSTDVDKDGNEEIKFRDIYVTKSGTEGNYGDYRTEKFTNDGRTADGRYWVPNDEKSTLTDEQIAEIAKLGYSSDEYKKLPFEDQLKVDIAIQKAEKEAVKEKAAASKSTSGGTSYGRNYSYNYSSSGGGGSSNYNPKIYNMKGGSLSVNKPASMYTKTPYSANKSYLSPDFQTKGSREAYKRSEY